MANAAPFILGAFGVLMLSRAFRRSDSSMNGGPASPEPNAKFPDSPDKLVWPIDERQITKYGDTVMEKRPSTGKPHKGIDIFAPARTLVRSASAGTVIRVIDGRESSRESSKAAGLWIDIKGTDSLIYRYLHLGIAYVKENEKVTQGTPLGYIALPNTSGLSDATHLHFEIRQADYTALRNDYGLPIDPLTKLSPLRR